MARCIDVDEYRKRLEMICGDGYTKQVIDIFIDWFMSIAESTESEDVAPVVHAHWIEEEDCMAVTDIPWSMCSACGSYSLKLPYCAFCGAKMDEKEGKE